ncbi:unnamed protein product [Oppiella nova]|uniref:Uncharacterized protein n=1 Tax=Oppiella nova TaxID=334625 RepID=A0A7R9QJP2_9ACAR|nr:unnamed protein product [Oppiella nova]CAG2167290.1 unnamed protein product [Oppiella nova]
MSQHLHFRRSYRSAPPKLVPAIISCQTSCCLVFLGVVLLIAGSIARFVAGNDSPPSKEFDTKFFNDARSDFAKGPRIVGGILLIIGSAITGVSIIGFIMSCCFYAKYQGERHLVITAQPMSNPILFNPNMTGAYPHAPTPIQIPVSNVDYPYTNNMSYQYPGPVVSSVYKQQGQCEMLDDKSTRFIKDRFEELAHKEKEMFKENDRPTFEVHAADALAVQWPRPTHTPLITAISRTRLGIANMVFPMNLRHKPTTPTGPIGAIRFSPS